MESSRETSPRRMARIAGFFYFLNFLTGAVAVFATRKLVVSADAARTAANILANRPLFWLGFAAYTLVAASYIAVTALFYEIFRPVNRSVSLLAAFFSLVGCAIVAASALFYLGPIVVLGGAPYLSVFNAAQLQALALTLLKLFGQCFNISFVFFGFYCLLIGCLVFKSTFLPRVIGVLMMFAGLGWLTYLSPPLANVLHSYVLIPGLIGEGSLTLWLLFAGVNAEKWKEQAVAINSR
jgi:Domain of unknown function (DUF4386)